MIKNKDFKPDKEIRITGYWEDTEFAYLERIGKPVGKQNLLK